MLFRSPNTATISWDYKPTSTSPDGNLSFTIEVNDDHGGKTSQVVNLIRYPINAVATATDGHRVTVGVGSLTTETTGTLVFEDPDDNNENTLKTYGLVNAENKSGNDRPITMKTTGEWTYTPDGTDGYDYFLAKRTDSRTFETVQAINLYLGKTAAVDGLIGGDVSGTANYKSTNLTNITGKLTIKGGTAGTFAIIDQGRGGIDQSKEGASVEINKDGEWKYTPETDFKGGNDFFLVKFTDNIGTETVQAINVFISPVDNVTTISPRSEERRVGKECER